MPKATGQGGTAELANTGDYLLGIPWDYACLFHVPILMRHRGCAGASETVHICILCQKKTELGRLEPPCQEVPGSAPHPKWMASIQWLMQGSKSPAAPLQGGTDPAEVLRSRAPHGTRGDWDFSQNLSCIWLLLPPCCVSYSLQVSPEKTPSQNSIFTHFQFCFQGIQPQREVEVGCEPRSA